ncbi:hypothetical protein FA15DRAFT_716641 [Coprinopsis marcescibilis]|uniref:SET domain-containing protein n=1 Tax=Coprinopsis marcescibilis TaxID=230819 RepID=A0A5C3LI78_COPMA|nr:hypothetical protein FA15DRAFT_716641 [Coprinopsis marcescibilis]
MSFSLPVPVIRFLQEQSKAAGGFPDPGTYEAAKMMVESMSPIVLLQEVRPGTNPQDGAGDKVGRDVIQEENARESRPLQDREINQDRKANATPTPEECELFYVSVAATHAGRSQIGPENSKANHFDGKSPGLKSDIATKTKLAVDPIDKEVLKRKPDAKLDLSYLSDIINHPTSKYFTHVPTGIGRPKGDRKFPLPVPRFTVPKHVVKETDDSKGLGVYAIVDIAPGELIYAERPFMVLSQNTFYCNPPGLEAMTKEQVQAYAINALEQSLEKLVQKHMFEEDRKEFMKLANSHKEDGSGPLTGIVRTNQIGVSMDTKIGYEGEKAVARVGSRVNHSCVPNIGIGFHGPSFSVLLLSKRFIKAGEQLFISYCATNIPTPQRQAALKPYGIQCDCRACVGDKVHQTAWKRQGRSDAIYTFVV